MSDSLRVALLGDFKHDTLRGLTINTRRIMKGLIQNGCDVLPISYRNLLLQRAAISNVHFARRFAKDPVDRYCSSFLKAYRPDAVLVLAFRYFDDKTLVRLREAAPEARFVGWYEDSLDGVGADVQACCRQLDWITATGAGRRLEALARHCKVGGAFMPNPCDPDMDRTYPVEGQARRKLLFIGKPSHRHRGTDGSRATLLAYLRDHAGLKLLGDRSATAVRGLDYYDAICSADMNLSINATSDIPMYHSDRLIHLLACGGFVLASWVPQSERLFQDGEHLRYFKSQQECVALIQQYGDDAAARRQIALQGQSWAYEQFHCRRIAGDMVDLATRGDYDAPWKVVFPGQAGCGD